MKLPICDSGEYYIFLKSKDGNINLSDSGVHFTVCYNPKDSGNNSIVIHNIKKETFIQFLEIMNNSVKQIIENFNIAENLKSDPGTCLNITRDVINK